MEHFDKHQPLVLIKQFFMEVVYISEGVSVRHGASPGEEPVGPPRQQPATRGGTLRTRVSAALARLQARAGAGVRPV